MATILEIAQWVVIAFMAVFLLGLTRQLGIFLVPRREQLAADGPRVGEPLDESLLTTVEADELRQVVSPFGAGVVAVIDERCQACQSLVATASNLRVGKDIPVAAVVRSSGAAFIGAVRDAFPLVIVDHDGDRTLDAGVVATPFMIVVDSSLRVTEKVVGADSFSALVIRLSDRMAGVATTGGKA